MKILLISDYSVLQGGVEVYQHLLRSLLRQAGHDVRLFSSNIGTESARNADFECWGTRQRHLNRLLQTFNPVATRALKRVLSSFEPDLVHLNLYLTQLSPSILSVLKEIPLVYTAHMYRMICPLGQKLFPDGRICLEPSGLACLRNKCLTLPLWMLDMTQKLLMNQYSGSIDAIWANSHCTARFLERSGVRVDRVQRYFLTSPVQDIPVPEGRPTAGFVGRLVPEKGVDVLLRAMVGVLEVLPEARLLIVGEGKEKERLMLLAADLGLSTSVEFMGYLAPERLPEFWRRIHLQVVPSLWAEPFGLVAPEAMAAGRAVVATRGGGLEESVVDGDTGLLVEPGNSEELAGGMISLLGDIGKCEVLGSRAKKFCTERFDNDQILSEHILSYKALLNRP